MNIRDIAYQVSKTARMHKKISIYEKALAEIGAANNPASRSGCPRLAREALLKAKELVR